MTNTTAALRSAVKDVTGALRSITLNTEPKPLDTAHKPHSTKQRRRLHEAGSLQLKPPHLASPPSGRAAAGRYLAAGLE